MRVAIVPEWDPESETEPTSLAHHVEDPELRQQLSLVPQHLTAADALGTVLELGTPLGPETILVRLESYEALEPERAALLDADFHAAEDEVNEQIETFLAEAKRLVDAGDLEAAGNHYRAADGFLRHEASERRATLLAALADVERRRGNPKQAKQLLDEALSILPTHTSMLEQRAELALQEGESAVAAGMHQRLLGQREADPEESVRLCAAIASECLAAARQALEHALKIKSGDRKLLQRLGRVHEAQQDWAASVGVAVELAEGIPSKSARARALVAAAKLCSEKTKNTPRAVAIYEAAIEDDPEVPGGFSAVEAELEKAADHEGLASAYERQIERLIDPEHKGALLRKLTEVYWQRLKNNDQAINALERLIELLPDDPNARFALAKLLEEEGNDYGAIRSLEIAATLAPRSSEIYRRLYELVSRSSHIDRAFLLCSVLVGLGEAEINEQLCYTQYAPEGLLQTTRSFGDATWSEVLPSGHIAEIDQVMAAIEPAAMGYWFKHQAPRLKDLMPNEKSRVNPKKSTVSAVRCFQWASRLLNIDEPAFYVEPSNARVSVATLPTQEPALLLGRNVLSGRSMVELSFIAAHHLAYSRPAWRVLAFWTDAAALQALLYAAVMLVKPALELPLGELGKKLRNMLSDKVEPEQSETLTKAVESLLSSNHELDVVAWARSVEEAACRVALLASGDVTVAGSVLAVAGAPLGGESAADRARDLLPYSVSREFAALRKDFGVAVK
jgi:tetratricopeptide (TPR) repeat protein